MHVNYIPKSSVAKQARLTVDTMGSWDIYSCLWIPCQLPGCLVLYQLHSVYIWQRVWTQSWAICRPEKAPRVPLGPWNKSPKLSITPMPSRGKISRLSRVFWPSSWVQKWSILSHTCVKILLQTRAPTLWNDVRGTHSSSWIPPAKCKLSLYSTLQTVWSTLVSAYRDWRVHMLSK